MRIGKQERVTQAKRAKRIVKGNYAKFCDLTGFRRNIDKCTLLGEKIGLDAV
jgi:hypothetical protein